MTPRIALTGGIACGKSLVARYLNELGVETIDADDVVHELTPDPEERRRIAAVAAMPPAAGIAVGVDRLVMLVTGAKRIEDVLWEPVA